MIEQRTFPLPGSIWNPAGPADLTGYEPPPCRARKPIEQRAVTIIGTVRNEATQLARSLQGWVRQMQPGLWRVVLLVLDDGSNDEPERVVAEFKARAPAWMDLRYVRLREAGSPERSCTLAFNIAFQLHVWTPFVLVQWWDRIPGHQELLRRVLRPHEDRTGIVTSGVSRHIGGSSSMEELTPEALAHLLELVPWHRDLTRLADIAGPIGGHCVPGSATESSFWCVPLDEVMALGGYDERYRTRAGYANVELFRRFFEAGLVVQFVPEPYGSNFHQSHAANRVKDSGFLDDRRTRRNQGVEWGRA